MIPILIYRLSNQINGERKCCIVNSQCARKKQIPTTAPIATEVVPLPKSPVWQKAALLTTGGPGPSGTGKPCCQLSGSPESRGAGASICYFQDWQNMQAGAGKEPGR